jgi:HEAT repeat protein
MKWQLTDNTSELIRRLYELEPQGTWFLARWRFGPISALLEQVGKTGEPAAVSAVAGFLLSESPEVRAAAGRAVASLLSLVPPEELLCLNEVFDSSWRWYVSKAWNSIKPAAVKSLVGDVSVQTPILGLLSFHRNGYVRHEAVRLLAEVHDGTELPYLLVRQNDWVGPISEDARAAVEERLVNENLVHFIHNIPLVVHLLAFKRRDHSGIVRRVVEMLVQARHEGLLFSALRSPNRTVRRWIAKLALDIVGDHHARIVRFGVDSDDVVLRLWSCRLVCGLFGNEEVKQILGKLKQDISGTVRSEAFWNEAQAFPNDAIRIWRDALLDRRFSLRETAQSQLGKMGMADVAPVYRDALARNPDSVTALLGLGETGNESDLPVIRPCLKDVLPSRRRAAVRGLARIGGEAVTDELVECLRDESPTIVREVRRQLEEPGRVLKGESLLAVVNDESRLHCRQEAIRLIFSMSKWRSLPWLIYAAGHPDPETAGLARQFIEAWFSPPLCNKVWTRPSSKERETIDMALLRSRQSLDLLFQQKLDAWLNGD